MTVNVRKAPFPWFGGKSKAALAVWAALGDVEHYIEPFCGSCAVLLQRPHLANRPYHSETVNDADGLLCNALRGIQWYPDETAEAASWPVCEADLHARHLALVRWREERQLEHLMGDPGWCDPKMAGWWLWGVSSWIGSGWCSGRGAWHADDQGRLVKQLRDTVDNGRGVNHANLREPGVDVDPGGEWHPWTMPELLRWFGWLSARMRHVRVLNGDWTRCLTPSASKTLSVGAGDGVCGVFLDPPYATSAGRADGLYSSDSGTVAHDVADWALEHGDDPDYRIVVAGYDVEHGDRFERAGWTEVEWFTRAWLTGGMGNIGRDDDHQQHRERLWCSPHCLIAEEQPEQLDLFGHG